MAGQKNMLYRKEARRESARNLLQLRSNRTDVEQLNILDLRLGKEQGALKERIRLITRIEKAKPTKKKTTKQGETE